MRGWSVWGGRRQYGSSTGRRQLYHCARVFFSFKLAFFIAIPFLYVSSFRRPSLLLLGCCSNDIVFAAASAAAAPSRFSFLPSLGYPHYATPPLPSHESNSIPLSPPS